MKSKGRIDEKCKTMTKEELKIQLGDDLCNYCPWMNGDIDHCGDSLCEGLYCDNAFNAFMDENQGYFDDSVEQ